MFFSSDFVAMSKLTKAMCWKLMTIKTDELNEVGAAIYQKPMTNECYNERSQDEPPLCKDSDDQNAAWLVSLFSHQLVMQWNTLLLKYVCFDVQECST